MPQSAAVRSNAAGAAGRPTGAPLVTGGGGFAGPYLVERLAGEGLAPAAPPHSELDLLDADAVRGAIARLQPATVFHLAAFSSVRLSWERPHEALLSNIAMTLNVLEAVRREAPGARVILVGSGQVYGEPDILPVTEDAPLRPGNAYSVSKATSDMLGHQYAEAHAMYVVRLRAFNHAGPGQSDEYVLASLTRQVAEAEAAGREEVVLRTGDVSAGRDFTDVRDVVRAYALAADAPPGAYNVCCGRCTTVAELIELIRAETRVAVRHEVDPAELRPNDAREMRGSHERLTAATGWRPEIPLAETVRATLGWWRERSG